MGLTERVWDAFANTIKLNDKVDRLSTTVAKQQSHIEDLNARVIRLEAALEFALGAQRSRLTSCAGLRQVISHGQYAIRIGHGGHVAGEIIEVARDLSARQGLAE